MKPDDACDECWNLGGEYCPGDWIEVYDIILCKSCKKNMDEDEVAADVAKENDRILD